MRFRKAAQDFRRHDASAAAQMTDSIRFFEHRESVGPAGRSQVRQTRTEMHRERHETRIEVPAQIDRLRGLAGGIN